MGSIGTGHILNWATCWFFRPAKHPSISPFRPWRIWPTQRSVRLSGDPDRWGAPMAVGHTDNSFNDCGFRLAVPIQIHWKKRLQNHHYHHSKFCGGFFNVATILNMELPGRRHQFLRRWIYPPANPIPAPNPGDVTDVVCWLHLDEMMKDKGDITFTIQTPKLPKLPSLNPFINLYHEKMWTYKEPKPFVQIFRSLRIDQRTKNLIILY